MPKIEIENQGLTNSMMFVDMEKNVDIDSAYDWYVKSEKIMKENLKTLIKESMSEESVLFQIKSYSDMYYTLWKNYKEYQVKK